MGTVSTYLNFKRETEEAFKFYKSVFGSEYMGEISRFRDIPSGENMMQIAEEDKNLVMHMAMPILGGHLLMGSDAPESGGFRINPGNNVYIMLSPDTKEETTKLFRAISEGGHVEMELADTFW